MARVYAGTPATSKSATPASRAQRMATGRRPPEPVTTTCPAPSCSTEDAKPTAQRGSWSRSATTSRTAAGGAAIWTGGGGGGGGVDLGGGGVGSHAGLDSAGVPSVTGARVSRAHQPHATAAGHGS